jgi:hypothetical protein
LSFDPIDSSLQLIQDWACPLRCPKRWFGTGRPFEQDVERGERSVTAPDILLQVELVRIAQFVARVHLLLENSQIIPNHDDFVEECFERDFFRLKRTFRRLHDQRPVLKPGFNGWNNHVYSSSFLRF